MPILVVDDDDAIRLVISTILTEEGYHVAEAVHGQAALTQLQTSTPLPCLIILDPHDADYEWLGFSHGAAAGSSIGADSGGGDLGHARARH